MALIVGRPTDEPKQVSITFRLSLEVKTKLEQISERDDVPMSLLVRNFVLEGLEKYRNSK